MPLYLDNHATTPLLPQALEAMSPYFSDHFGNPSSQHSWGWKAKMAIEKARTQVAKLFNCDNEQIIFTSGATESIHMAAIGWLLKQKDFTACTLLTSTIEHKATYGAFELADRLGATVKRIPVTTMGQIDLEALYKEIPEGKPTFITLIHGHNEIGSLNPIEDIHKKVHPMSNVTFHIDAAQSTGKINIDFKANDFDLLSVSAHKLYGPKGVGCLILRNHDIIQPLFTGGGQEYDMRAGTLNVPGIVGFGVACAWSKDEGLKIADKLRVLRDQFFSQLRERAPQVKINGHLTERLPHNVNITLPGVNSDQIADALEGIAYSGSSACSSGKGAPSMTLPALGITAEDAKSTFRLGLCVKTTENDLNMVLDKIVSLVNN